MAGTQAPFELERDVADPDDLHGGGSAGAGVSLAAGALVARSSRPLCLGFVLAADDSRKVRPEVEVLRPLGANLSGTGRPAGVCTNSFLARSRRCPSTRGVRQVLVLGKCT